MDHRKYLKDMQLMHPGDLSRLTGARNQETDRKAPRPGGSNGLHELHGASPCMQQVTCLLEKAAPADVTVLLLGESGTGKELAASAIHRMSRRSRGPFLPVNCGGIAPNLIESELFGHERGSFTGAVRTHHGWFERASGGTLLLDEITEMPLALQAKLLRALESGTVTRVGGSEQVPFDARVIAATNRDPEEAVEKGRLRQDLLYRLSVFPIHLPPLRSRGEDVVLLARFFLETFCSELDVSKTLSPDTLEVLRLHDWPGNVRELRNAIERAVIVAEGPLVEPEHLPTALTRPSATDRVGAAEFEAGRGSRRHNGNNGGAACSATATVDAEHANADLRLPAGIALEEARRRLIMDRLKLFDGDKMAAAESLGISIRTLYNRLKEYREDPRQG